MQNFVAIFRQGPQPLSEEQLQLRAANTPTWARTQNAAGRKLDPRILAPDSTLRGATPEIGWPVTALLFLEALDLTDAAEALSAHPALTAPRISVELRPWSPPAPPTTLTTDLLP